MHICDPDQWNQRTLPDRKYGIQEKTCLAKLHCKIELVNEIPRCANDQKWKVNP